MSAGEIGMFPPFVMTSFKGMPASARAVEAQMATIAAKVSGSFFFMVDSLSLSRNE